MEDKIILDSKPSKSFIRPMKPQLTNYLKATGLEVGLLINFGERAVIKPKVFTLLPAVRLVLSNKSDARFLEK